MGIIQQILQTISRSVETDEIAFFVRIRFRDDTEEDHLVYLTRDGVDPFISVLVNRVDVQEAWVFEQVHHHRKAVAKSTQWAPRGLDIHPLSTHI